MQLSIKHPERFYIPLSQAHDSESAYGGNQEWFPDKWQQRAGCGATCAATITAYMALEDTTYYPFYPHTSIELDTFVPHMIELFDHITPGPMGVNKISKFTAGLSSFAHSKQVDIHIHAFSLEHVFFAPRDTNGLYAFIEKGLGNNCPIAFLNLSRGAETRLQSWHWITITEAILSPDHIIATASDEGNRITFDLLKWYHSTRMHGGLVYLT